MNKNQQKIVQYTSLEIVNTLIFYYGSQHNGIEHFKLQKVLYFAYGWWLTGNKVPLCSEAPQVWSHGPIFCSLYHSLKFFGHRKLSKPIQSNPFVEADIIQDRNVIQFLDWIWIRYGHLNSFYLSELAHEKGSPWQIMAEQYDYRVPVGLIIPDNLILSKIVS